MIAAMSDVPLDQPAPMQPMRPHPLPMQFSAQPTMDGKIVLQFFTPQGQTILFVDEEGAESIATSIMQAAAAAGMQAGGLIKPPAAGLIIPR